MMTLKQRKVTAAPTLAVQRWDINSALDLAHSDRLSLGGCRSLVQAPLLGIDCFWVDISMTNAMPLGWPQCH